MPDNPSIFSRVYELQFVGGQFSLIGTTPSGTNVTVKDDINDGNGDVHSAIGDIANDQFDVLSSGALNGGYTFVSVATIGSTAGFIAQNGAGQYVYFTNDTAAPADVGAPAAEQAGPQEVCFMPGTRVRTPDGDIAVEKLHIGDLVQSVDGRPVAVRWVGKQTVAPRFADELRLPVRIKAGALAENVPCNDLLVSPDHALLIDGALVHAGALVNGTSVVREKNVPPMFTYFHVEAEDHVLILAENTPAETFVDNVDRRRFDNWREYEALYPDAAPIAELPYPRAKSARQVPKATCEKLAARALLLGETTAAAA